MNALKLIAPAGQVGSTATGLSGQTPEGHEGAFGDTLSTVLAGTVIAPIAQQSQLGIKDLAAFSLTAAQNVPAELEASGAANFPEIGGQQLGHPLIGIGVDAGNELVANTEPLLQPTANPQSPGLPTLPNVVLDQPSASTEALFSVDQKINQQPIIRSPVDGLAATNTSLAANEVSPPVLPTTGAKVGDAAVSEPAFQPIPAKHLEANPLNSSIKLPNQVQPSNQQVSNDVSRAAIYLTNGALAPDQRPLQPNQQSALGQRASSSEIKAHSLANNLSQKGQHVDTTLITKETTPVVSTPVHNVGVIEVGSGEIASNTETLEFFGSDSSRLDFNNSLNSKPQTQVPQSPQMQIAMQVTRALPQGVDRFTIQLHPMELGTVDVQLNFAEDGHVSALIVAERPETLDMLQRDSRALERSLTNAGLQLENGSLSFSLKQEQGGQGFSQSDFGQSQTGEGGSDHDNNGSGRPHEQEIQVSRHRLLDIRT